MSIILIASIVVIVFIFVKLGTNKDELVKEQSDRIIQLEKDREKYIAELDRNKDVYNSDRRSLISENESHKVKIDYLERELNSLTSEKSLYYSQLDNMDNSAREMTPEEFLNVRERVLRQNSRIHDFTGIYVLENKTHDKFYVGQSISLYRRAGSHFTGEGNKDIYEDYKNGDEWTIKLISLANSGFNSINALEKHFIKYHKSTHNGYNRTVGNIN